LLSYPLILDTKSISRRRTKREHKRIIREIEKRGAAVLPVPFDKPSEVGGGIRCSTHPLARDA
jgi:N-dimethylarginine dimethylaminohydrolase